MKNNQPETFKGFEIFFSRLQMRAKMIGITIILIAIVHLILTVLLSYFFQRQEWAGVAKYVWAHLSHFQIPDLTLVRTWIKDLLHNSLVFFALSGVVWLMVPSIFRWYREHGERNLCDEHIRGVQIVTPYELQMQTGINKEVGRIHIGPILIPMSMEPKHCLIIGRPGVGKTIALRKVIEDIRAARKKAIVYDFKGDYLSSFYQPSEGDLIFNPLDARAVGWNLFSEIETVMDIDSIATSMISPNISTTDPFWPDAARDVFAGLLRVLWATGARSNKDIWAAITAPAADIAKWLKKTPGGERGYRYIEDAGSKQAMSVLSVLMQYCKSFQFLTESKGDFSLKRWVEKDSEKGILFVTSYADIADTLRPILSLMVDLVGRKLLSLPEDYSRRLFFVIDEFGTLQRLSTIQNLLILSRSKGGSVWLAIQDIGQIDHIYGREGRQTIVNACGSFLTFAVADPDTARYLSDKIGDREYSSVDETITMAVKDGRDGISAARKHKTERLILPSELSGLKALTGYLKLPGTDIAKVKMQYRDYPVVAPTFVMREGLSLQ